MTTLSDQHSSTPRSLADALRAMDEKQLVTLLRERPDLAQPRPASLSELVERAGAPASAQQAVDRLDLFQRRVAETLAALVEPVSARHLAGMLGADLGAVEAALTVLQRRALAWGNGRTVQLTRAAASAFGPHPAGLAAPSPVPLPPEQVNLALAEADAEEHRLLADLAWHPRGRLRGATRPMTLQSASSPAERLLARRLLRPLDEETVVLPREVALNLREGAFFPDQVSSRPPELPPVRHGRAHILGHAALGSAGEALELVTRLVEAIVDLAPRVLSTGGLGRRELKQLAADAPLPAAGLGLALARQAGLLGAHGPTWLATPAYDRWDALPGWEQWRILVRAWTQLDRWPTTGVDPLAPTGQPGTTGRRRAVLAELRGAEPGTPVDAGLLTDRVAWRHPVWPLEAIEGAVTATLAEARLLGAVALEQVSPLLTAEEDPGFPERTHQFVLQSDLSAVQVGPLQTEVRRRLDLLTEREGSGRRFTSASIRRGLDSGLTSEQLVDWLRLHSVTEVPQGLEYLVSDVARVHGLVRVMPAAAVVTIDDPALVEVLLRSPEARTLGLLRVGPSAIATQADVEEVVEVLRRLGHAPVPTDEQGQPLLAPLPRRAVRAAQPPTEADPPTRDQLALLARALVSQARPDTAVDPVERLREALTSGEWVDLTHVDGRGMARSERVRVLGLQAGQVRVVRKASAPITLPVARVVEVTSMS